MQKVFSKKLNLKDSYYILADSWDLLTKENLTKAWNKLWPENTETKEDNENERETTNHIKDVTKLCQSISGFKNCDETDAAEWLNIDANDQGYEIFNDNVNSVQAYEDQQGNDSEDDDDTCAEAFTVLVRVPAGEHSSASFAAKVDEGLGWQEESLAAHSGENQ